MNGGHSDPHSVPGNLPVPVNGRHDSSAKSILAEFKWFRISRIGMPVGVLGTMVVAQKRVVQARLLDL